ncbi:MAG TPA: FHA domain-containing protein [Thermoanaerobaculaceae bacterium]|nr:FHA domain-containing protein [Thermoanaerobaculaceae bacterium]HRS17002.1 FHA domain-containing protein [Thermoanaerobaculaceae bacterium]
MVRLRIVQSPDGNAVERVLDIGADEVVVGRSHTAGICVADPSVSSQHAALRATGSGVQVRDLGSRNGVRVNGQLVASASLGPGDEVTLGHTTLHVEEPTCPIPVAPPPRPRPEPAASPVTPARHVWPAIAAVLGLALLIAAGILVGRHHEPQRSDPPATLSSPAASELETARNELQQADERYTRLITEQGAGSGEEARAVYAAALARVKALETSPAAAGRPGAIVPAALESAIATLGPEGGVVTLPGGARIDLPAGALHGAVAVTLERLPDGPSAMPLYRVTAGGGRLGAAATLTVPLSEQDAREAVAIDAIHIHDDRDPGSVLPVALHPGQRTASVRLERFSIVGVLVVRGAIGLLAGPVVTGLVANTESAFQQAAVAAVAAARNKSVLLRLPPFHQHGAHTMWCWASSMSAALQYQRDLEATLTAPVRPHTLAAWGRYGQGEGPSAAHWTTNSAGILAHLASLSGAEVEGRYWARYPALAAYLVQQLDAGYPVLIDIRAKTHTVVVAGYDTSGVWVLDPAGRRRPPTFPGWRSTPPSTVAPSPSRTTSLSQR